LSRIDRNEIEILKTKKYSSRDIGKVIGVSHNTIAYELKKKTRKKSRYNAHYAQHLTRVYQTRRRKIGKKIVSNTKLRRFIEKALLDDQSPEGISGRLKKVEQDLSYVSARAIREYIKSPYGRQIEYHRSKLKRKRRRKIIKKEIRNKRMISKRPKKINERKGIGHMEGDFIVSGKSGKGMILGLGDRNNRVTLLEKILPVSFRTVRNALMRMKKRYPEMKSITFDNDILLLEHKKLEKLLNIKIYFCHPRSPWEKPGIENVNKVMRKYIPKSSDISKYSRRYVTKLEEKLNRRFMEVLNFQSPHELLERYRKRKNPITGSLKK